MRILVVSSYLPYPLHSGGHIRLYNILSLLSKRHEITLVCERRDSQTEKNVAEVGKICKKVEAVPRRKQWSLGNILKAGFSANPFLVVGHENKAMKIAIKEILKAGDIDLVHLETSYISQNLPEKVKAPVVLVEHNIEYFVYKRYADKASLAVKPFLLFDVLKLRIWEEKLWKKVDAVVTVSYEDKKIVKASKVEVVSNGVDIEKFKVQSSKFKAKEKKVLFIGEFKWIQNRDALRWILKDIWPELRHSPFAIRHSLRLWVVGKNIPDDLKKLGDESVIFDENASEKTEEIYEKASVLLAPIRVGGGTSFKILEAMATGIPVLTTKLGAAGIGARDGKEIVVAEEAQEFAEKLIEIYKDKEMYEKIAKNARLLIEKKYSWEKIVSNLENVYKEVLND